MATNAGRRARQLRWRSLPFEAVRQSDYAPLSFYIYLILHTGIKTTGIGIAEHGGYGSRRGRYGRVALGEFHRR